MHLYRGAWDSEGVWEIDAKKPHFESGHVRQTFMKLIHVGLSFKILLTRWLLTNTNYYNINKLTRVRTLCLRRTHQRNWVLETHLEHYFTKI